MELIDQLAYEIVEGQITIDDVVDGLTEQELNQLQNVIKIYKSAKIALKMEAYKKILSPLIASQKSSSLKQSFLNLFQAQSLDMFNYELDGLQVGDSFKAILKDLEKNYRLGLDLKSSPSVNKMSNKDLLIDAFNRVHNVNKETLRELNMYFALQQANIGLQITEIEKKIGALQTVFIISFIGDALQEIANALNPNV